eukprot:TRINITY_DN8961_c0_g1_i1.p1 TRINITY_DN8961_c0_g1~~TRINITY_DN8961_c0_g1_i1.p1  ORF type:complete len:108 (+),score=6.88 TRINITY_DN8961_c0_g1_i1:59-382(+)
MDGSMKYGVNIVRLRIFSKDISERLYKYGMTADDTKWAVTEKVHGANFAITYNGKEFGAAKRHTILHELALFFPGWQDVVENEKPHIKTAFNYYNKLMNKIELIDSL